MGLSLFTDSETGKQKCVNTSSRRVREIYRNNALSMEHKNLEIFKKSKVDHANISVQTGYIQPLMNLFKKRWGKLYTYYLSCHLAWLLKKLILKQMQVRII